MGSIIVTFVLDGLTMLLAISSGLLTSKTFYQQAPESIDNTCSSLVKAGIVENFHECTATLNMREIIRTCDRNEACVNERFKELVKENPYGAPNAYKLVNYIKDLEGNVQ